MSVSGSSEEQLGEISDLVNRMEIDPAEEHAAAADEANKKGRRGGRGADRGAGNLQWHVLRAPGTGAARAASAVPGHDRAQAAHCREEAAPGSNTLQPSSGGQALSCSCCRARLEEAHGRA